MGFSFTQQVKIIFVRENSNSLSAFLSFKKNHHFKHEMFQFSRQKITTRFARVKQFFEYRFGIIEHATFYSDINLKQNSPPWKFRIFLLTLSWAESDTADMRVY